MGFNIGPLYLGDIRCPKCNKVMVAVAGNRACPMGHSWASSRTKWEPDMLDRNGSIELLNNLVASGYLSQRNYKFAMQQFTDEAKNLPGEAVEPATNFKLFSDNDNDGEVKGLLKRLSRGVKKGLKQPAKSKKKNEAIENPEDDGTIPIEGPDNNPDGVDGHPTGCLCIPCGQVRGKRNG